MVQTSTWNFVIIINKIVQNNNISPSGETEYCFGVFFKQYHGTIQLLLIKGAKIAKDVFDNFIQGQPKVPGGYVQGPISSSILFKLYSIGDKLFVFVNSTTW